MARDSDKSGIPGRRLQGDFILSAARSLYFYGACVAFFAIVVGITASLYFLYVTSRTASEVPVPEAYVSVRDTVELESLKDYLAPPQNIRFVVVAKYIDRALNGNEILGYFEADTPNGLTRFPNDFEFIGGADGDLFRRHPKGFRAPSGDLRSGLRASPAFVAELNRALPNLVSRQSRSFELRVIARDAYRNLSTPTNVTFTLEYGPVESSTDVLEVAPQGAQPTEHTFSDLELLARDIALIIDPSKRSDYFNAYNQAKRVPRKCGVNDDNAVFILNFRRAFNEVKADLKASNIAAFYDGVCNAWKNFEHDEDLLRSKADAKRNAAIEENRNRRAEAAFARTAAAISSPIAWGVTIAGLLSFMFISLFLAFLAMENHSRAIRRAVEVLAQKK